MQLSTYIISAALSTLPLASIDNPDMPRSQIVELPTVPPSKSESLNPAGPPPPCRADFNRDNTVDIFDYLDFVDVFSAGTFRADFNFDNVIDLFDYLDFLRIFNFGC